MYHNSSAHAASHNDSSQWSNKYQNWIIRSERIEALRNELESMFTVMVYLKGQVLKIVSEVEAKDHVYEAHENGKTIKF